MKKWVFIIGGIVVLASGIVGAVFLSQPEKTEITTDTMSAQSERGKIVSGQSVDDRPTHLQTAEKLTYESAIIQSSKPSANSAILSWDQTEGKGDVDIEFRVNNGDRWSEWVDANNPAQERPDNVQVQHKAMILADHIRELQYRFTVSGENNQPSPTVDLSKSQIELVDTTKGPSPTKKTPFDRLLGKLGLVRSATARADGPRVFTRADWGSPQPDGSPDWSPEYRKVNRAVVHHTATAMTSDAATMIRAIWYYHTYSNGWGDIGYNYLVDGYGNIYQGRYFDHAYANNNRVDVVGGHAYGWNYGTIGIAALGDFTGTNNPPDAMLRSIGNIIAYKLSKSDIEPSGYFDNTPAVVGHRDVVSTACPANIHRYLPNIRSHASSYYGAYNIQEHQDYEFIAEGKDGLQTDNFTMKAGETANLFIDLRNTGVDTWRQDGQFPVRMGADNPRDRGSSFATNTWINSGRPGTFTGVVSSYNGDGTANIQTASSVSPGQIARFVIPVKAPEQGGTYVEHFQPVVETYSWFLRDVDARFTINVTPRNFAWHGTSQKIFTDDTKSTLASSSTTMDNLRAGQRYYIEAKIKNDGDQTWTNSGPNAVKLGTYAPADRDSAVCDPATWENCHRAATMAESSVAPGDTATFNFWVVMPYHTDDRQFREYFNLVSEGRAWGPNQWMYWQFNVTKQDLRAHATGIGAYTDSTKNTPLNLANVTPNQRFYMVVTIRNDGNVTWSPNGLRAIHLGTANPYDRHSSFCDTSWLNNSVCHRIADSDEATVAPGASGNYSFWMKAPASPGTHTEWVNLVSEGFAWFNSPHTPIVLTVQ